MRLLLLVLIFASTASAQNPVITTVCPTLYLGVPYHCQFTATGGMPPYRWTVVKGTLPPGLTLSTDGLLSGTVVACSRRQRKNCLPVNTAVIEVLDVRIPVARAG